ncbi:MAG: hypothetical protein QNK23_17300 [Crocinitomicaceae bacterium]|nr:hypothetical protein [Crocinitomicaceae bacterium]
MAFVLALVYACSTEKNTFIHRSFHGLNAHYNGYFNANELVDQSMETYRQSAQEDYYEVLPIYLVPNEEDVVGMYPAIDTAILKCLTVIRDHSMPSNDRPHLKKEEHNRWIDENWTTIGIAAFYRRDYELSLKNFLFVRKFYKNDPSLYIGELWMARTHIANGDLTKAKFNLDNLDQALEDEEKRKKEKVKKSKIKKKKPEKIAKFPRKIRFDFEKTKADLAYQSGDIELTITYLENSLEYARKSRDKVRVHFILGQLYEQKGEDSQAADHYKMVLRGDAPFQMAFNARLKNIFLGGGEKRRKHLNKMLKDAKNAEYKDQIYYALAQLEFNEGNEEGGIQNLHLCAFYSTNNTRQKGMAYEDLGDRRFDVRDYINAQKYYDSCATVITDAYPNAEAIRNKAENLADLVVAVETSQYEDSVQMIAALSDSERESFLTNFIKETKENEQRRKEREAERLRELQGNENLFSNDGKGSKSYWGNARARSDGFDEFKKLWGVRESEDDWRRSEKVPVANFEVDTLSDESAPLLVEEAEDTLTVEYLTSRLPMNDSLLALSDERLLQAHYNAGIIYKEQLNEVKIAEGEFEAVLVKNIENPHNVMAAFQLYKIHEGGDLAAANENKQYILNNYPNSDYANFLRDPNYFVKKKERDALAEQEYVKVLDRYNRGLYYPVITKADLVINDEPDNAFRAKYMLLKALAMGQIKENKKELLPVLDMVLVEFPGSSEAARAQELIDIINNGYSENIEADFGSKFPFIYDDKSSFFVVIFLDPKTSSGIAKSKVIDFHREYFSRDALKVDSKIYGSDQSIILVKEFATESEASEYIRVYKKTRKYLLDLQHAKILKITPDNLKILFQKQNLSVYEEFYEEYY